ncbi:hypothetical protein SDC9_145686 [bioreactor metagenome]|uniref:Uncharacterized protein n=1 Tax=bioreactor metagenome TaxID=1076179 RepID=A0A645EBK1_9ZZZZ|nr:hypothetical protein [Proteiniphilum sp.]MEA4918127.1 hypothetical protein [Proteiniphilum sp.]
MKTLQITEANARKLYKDATPEFKVTLEDTFGKEYFSRKVTDCDTYEEVCHFIGETPIDEEELRRLGFTQDEIDYRKLKTITKAYNDGWVPDWKDDDQPKYFPYFSTGSSSGFAFLGTVYDYSDPNAGCGSRLCFKSKELAEYAGRQFVDLYRGFML